MYETIEFSNFRSIKSLKIENLKRINLFVGKNNCGKTSILEGLFLLSGASNPNSVATPNILRGYKPIDKTFWEILFSDLDVSKNINLKSEIMAKNGIKRTKELSITPILQSTLLDTTEIEHFIKNSNEQNRLINGVELKYYKDNNKNPTISKIKNQNGLIEFDSAKDYELDCSCMFITPRPIENIGIFIDSIIRNKNKDKIIKILQKIEPKITDITILSNGIVNVDIGLNTLVPINILGDGIIKTLSILAMIINAQNGMVLIDEIENGLDRISQTILWEAIFEASKEFNVQIFATTHSIEFLNNAIKVINELKLNVTKEEIFKLYRIEKKEDRTKAINYGFEILEASLNSGSEVR